MEQSVAWHEVGRQLRQAREAQRPKMSAREAARRAGISDITYRQLEAGQRQVSKDLTVPVSPRDDTLAKSAKAVGLDPAPLFELVGRTYEDDDNGGDQPGGGEPRTEAGVTARLDRIEAALRELRGLLRDFAGRGADRQDPSAG